MRVSVACPAVTDTAELRERARQIALQLPPRTPRRRAAAALWSALSTTRSVSAARRALSTFGSDKTQADAADLLGQLTGPRECAVAWNPDQRGYACTTCGTAAR